MIGFDGLEPSASFIETLRRTGAGSVILFSRNLVHAAQAYDLITAIRDPVDWPLIIAVDQEGGAVLRLTQGITVFPGNMALGAAADPKLAYEQGLWSGRQLRALGFDLNLAPVIDLQTNPKNPGIGIRSFGSQLEAALLLAKAYVLGHAEAGISCCLKHFPGKGAAGIDAHLDLPVLSDDLDSFWHPHVEMFSEVLKTCDPATTAVMSTHIVVKGLDPDRPATMSRRVITQILREQIGFTGLTLADCMEMGAIVKHWGVAEASLAAAQAGHDLIPICHRADRQLAAAERLERALASGVLDSEEHQESLSRIAAMANRERCSVGPIGTTHGDAVAREIARSALHCFGDSRGLLPIERNAKLLVVSPPTPALVKVEDKGPQQWKTQLGELFQKGGFEDVAVHLLEFDAGTPSRSLELWNAFAVDARAADRVLLLTWGFMTQPQAQEFLKRACVEFGEKLIVVHLRNPCDQSLTPNGITSLTTFGFRQDQLEAMVDCLAGDLAAAGRMPVPVNCD